jgi:hypothetical protein
MGNRPFILPGRKKKELPELNSWGNLKNKFAGKTLFRSRLFEIVTGDLSLIDTVRNKWFYEEICHYSLTSLDINMLPALRKIAGTPDFDESLRQKASEVEEALEELVKKRKEPSGSVAEGNEFEKADHARWLLSGTRYPQTTEILRLLRDKSIELKRLALFLIGKFKITDMIQEVCSCFNIKGLEEDAGSVLMSFGKMSPKEIDRCYLAVAGNQITNKAILRLLAQCNQPHDVSFLVERLWSASRQVREIVLDTLLELKYRPGQDEEGKLTGHIYNTFEIIAWLISAKLCLHDNSSTLLSKEINKEYERWLNYLLGLLYLTFGTTVAKRRNKMPGRDDLQSMAVPHLTRIIFGETGRDKKSIPDDYNAYLKKFRKLQKFFHGEIPSYDKLLEDVINCDYNILSVWTKACALRDISIIENGNFRESVLALLFSPEEILREEAAGLLARSAKEAYKIASERVPESSKKKLERIISDEISEKELIFEKVRFLSNCFGNINEDELVTLAEKTSYVFNNEKGIYSQPCNSILWSFAGENAVPEVIVRHDDNDIREMIKDLRTMSAYCYVLQLSAVREFGFEYPENTYMILKYIDSKEE